MVVVTTARGPWKLCPNMDCPGREKREAAKAARGRGGAKKASGAKTGAKAGAKAGAKKAAGTKKTVGAQKAATKKSSAKSTAKKAKAEE